jgi:small conductance mechanosensitive channel
MARALLGLALLLLLAAAPAGAAAPGAVALTAQPSVSELRSLVDTLQDDKARAALVAQLQALLAAQAAAGAAAAPAAPAPGDIVAKLQQQLDAFAGEVLAGVAVLLDAPRLVAWVGEQAGSASARAMWQRVIVACIVVFGLAIALEWIVRTVMARARRRIAPRADERPGLRLPFVAVGLTVELLPVAAFAGGAMLGMALTLQSFALGRAAIALLVQATITARLILAGSRALLTPAPGWPCLVPAGEETRLYLAIWLRRFTCLAVFGYGIAGAAWWLGVPGAIYALMLKVVVLGLLLFGVVFILQNRAAVAEWIAGKAAPEAPGWARLRRRLGESWHVAAILYLVAICVAYWLHDERGTGYVLRATAVSLAALVSAQLLARAAERLSRRGFALRPEVTARFPLLEARANRYLPLIVWLVTAVAYALAILVVLEAWDLGAFAWFAGGLGRRVSGGFLSVVLVLAVAVTAWEIVAVTIERNLAALDHDGAPSRTRRRTLLPLLRTVTACVIIAIAALVTLSQIGLDIGPLLAGAGVIGVAVGFGSQALIKDIITGFFILAEDQIAVGDIVDVGKEHAGVVEAITVRTICLRDLAGVVHTVPFSEVTTVKNMTRDFAFAVARVTIAYREDIDRVAEILRVVCDELAEDPELGPLIIDRFDYQGVESLNEFSVVLLLRVRTLPAKHFVVGRALNRRIKIAFDEHGIAMRDPSPVSLSGPAPAATTPEAMPERRRSA